MLKNYLFLFLLLIGISCLAQSPEGALSGTVVDPSGARLPGASVTLSARDFKLSRAAKTNKLGEFRMESLPPGAYEVKVEARGFAAQTSLVEIAVAATPTVNIKMQTAPVEQTLTVQGEPGSVTNQPIETTSSVVKTTIGINDLRE